MKIFEVHIIDKLLYINKFINIFVNNYSFNIYLSNFLIESNSS